MPRIGKTDAWKTSLCNSPLPSQLLLKEVQRSGWDSHYVEELFIFRFGGGGFAFSVTEFSPAHCGSGTVLSKCFVGSKLV